MRANSFSDFQRILGSLLIGASLCTNVISASAQQQPQPPPAPPSGNVPSNGVSPTGNSGRAPTASTDKSQGARPAAEAEKPNNSEAKAAPVPAHASASGTPPSSENIAAAKEKLAQGLAAYQAGDYATAASAFENSTRLAPSIEAQFWHAMALDLQGKTESALEAFERFFADPNSASLGADRIEPARQRFEVLKRIPATLNLQVTPASAQLKLDGQPTPGSGTFTLKLAAGKHMLQLEAEGHESIETELVVKAAQTLEQSVQLKPLPASPVAAAPVASAPTAPPPTPRSRVPAYVTLGVAGAGAVVGTIFGIQALGAKSDYDKQATTKNADDVERNALISDMAFGLAITLGITGVVLLTSDEPAEAAQGTGQATLQFAPYLSPRGGGAAARATF